MLLFVLTVFGLCGRGGVSADDISYADEAQDIIDSIIEYNLAVSGSADVQDWIDTSLADGAGSSSEWYIIGLMRDGAYDLSVYRDALLGYLSENRVTAAATAQKYAFILTSIGGGEDYVSSTAKDSIGTQGIMSYVWGLHLMNNGCMDGERSTDDVVRQILSMQLDDGGWAVQGEISDVDVTSMTVQALAPYYESNDSVCSAVDAAVSLLSARQLDDGDYASYGVPNPESTAQVIIAMTSLGIDCMNDERFIQNGTTLLDGMMKYALPDGGFSHSYGGTQNHMAVSQVYLALTAYLGMLDGDDGIYILHDDSVIPDAEKETSAFTETLSETQTDESEIADTAADVIHDEETSAGDISEVQDGTVSYKVWVSAAVIGTALLACVILALLGKRSVKNYIAVLVFVSAAVLFVIFTDFQSADEYYSGESTVKENAVGEVTVSIRCDTVAGMDAHIPADGVVLGACEFDIAEGDTVYSILTEAARMYGIHIDNSGSENMAYISGIANIYEFDFGELSGWMYFVNGEKASVGCSEYVLADGDRIEWIYSREMGKDLE